MPRSDESALVVIARTGEVQTVRKFAVPIQAVIGSEGSVTRETTSNDVQKNGLDVMIPI